jgi:predicted alpha-1,6-mannanase (GH76 family)
MRKLLSIIALLACTLVVQAQPEPGHIYSIRQNGKAPFIENASRTAASNVVIWTETNVPAQQWKLTRLNDNTYQFQNVYTGYYLSVNSGSVVQRAKAASRNYGVWNIEPVEGKPSFYRLLMKGQALCAPSFTDGDRLSAVEGTADNDVWELVDIADAYTEYSAGVRDDIMDGFIKKYYKRASTGYVLGSGGWWGDAEMFETILDAFETTGNRLYQTYFQQLYNNFCRRNGTDWSGNEYNDDITWMVLACIRAYKYFGTTDYLNKAKNNYDKMYARALQQYGTLIWKQSQTNKLATNSCINCPATVAACYLGDLTGDKTYYDKALNIYAAQRKLLFEASTGKVNDSGEWTASGGVKVNNYWASTYNQGTMLGAALMLYNLTKDNMYKQDAERIHNWTYNNLCNNQHLLNACQTIAGDLCGFKGIYMRYARRYAQELDHEDALQWMENNAWHAFQNRNSEGVIWSAWLTKSNESLRRQEGDKMLTCEPFSASTAVSVAFNAHVNRLFNKDAYSYTPVSVFDDIQRFQLQDDDDQGTTVTTVSVNNSHLGFRNVVFGSNRANRVVVRAKAQMARSRVIVYVDSIADSQVVGRSELLKQEWDAAVINLDTEVTGKHDIFFAFEGTGVQLAGFRFVDKETDVPTVSADEHQADDAIYDLQGRRLAREPDHGIFILGGRKTIK